MTPRERAAMCCKAIANGSTRPEYTTDDPAWNKALIQEDFIAAAIEEAENAAVAAALADVVRLLRHCGKNDTASRLIHALEADRVKVRQGHDTEFPALRAAVPLPA